MVSITLAKPTATVTIEPTGRRDAAHREHAVKVLLRLSGSQAKFSDKAHVANVARASLAAFPPANGQTDRRKVAEVSVTSKAGKGGGVVSTVMGVEGVAVSPGRPQEDAVDTVRDILVTEGYRVTVREKRDCAEPDCKADAMVDWNHAIEQPPGWHTTLICGGHNYRTCTKCKSLYTLTSMNSVGPAPSVHCEVCGLIIIEWGSSKIWQATLVSRASV
jgi:hypothetical protein